MSKLKIRSRGRLPHWEADQGVYFLTFRLQGSLPKAVLDRLTAEAKLENERNFKLSTRIEEYLDSGSGKMYLSNPRVAEMLAHTLQRFDGQRYRLFAWCIMPNHVHVVVQLKPGIELSDILHSWKSYSSQTANHILRRRGIFWQREYYDHLLREGELGRAITYTASNPERAGLRNWKWVYVSNDWT